jgi:hypothetical protein
LRKNSGSFAFCSSKYVAWSFRHVVYQDRDCRVGLGLDREDRPWARHHREQTQEDKGSPRSPEILSVPTILIPTLVNRWSDSHARLRRAVCAVKVTLAFGYGYLNTRKVDQRME